MELRPNRHFKVLALFAILPLDAAYPLSSREKENAPCSIVWFDRVRIHQLQRGLCAAALVTVTALLSASAQAGQCPADKVSLGARTTGEMKPKDVTDNVLGQVE